MKKKFLLVKIMLTNPHYTAGIEILVGLPDE